jgi:hypothetical protein
MTMLLKSIRALIFLCVFGAAQASAASFAITPGITGAWFNPDQSGQGFNIEVLANNQIDVFWYVFDSNGNNLWLSGVGVYGGDFPNTASIPLTQTSGGLFPPKFDSTKITRTPWGQLTITFNDCNTATATWTPTITGSGFAPGSLPIQRLTSIAGLSCP